MSVSMCLCVCKQECHHEDCAIHTKVLMANKVIYITEDLLMEISLSKKKVKYRLTV